jgi:hypothetical protein
MTAAHTDEQTPQKPLRLWPGVVAVVLQWLARFVVPFFLPEAVAFGVIGGLLGGLAVVVWWLFLSRAPWSERVGAIVLMIVALFTTSRVVHESIATGMMGMMFVIYAIPVLSLAFVAWAVASRRLSTGLRRGLMVATILLVCGLLTLLRTRSRQRSTSGPWIARRVLSAMGKTPARSRSFFFRGIPIHFSPKGAPRMAGDTTGYPSGYRNQKWLEGRREGAPARAAGHGTRYDFGGHRRDRRFRRGD